MTAERDKVSYYQVLGVSPHATRAEIRQAFRSKVRLTHPDLRHAPADPAPFRQVKQAYDVLSSPLERQRYDRTLGVGAYAAQTRFYRRSFSRVFDSMFNNLRVAVRSGIRLADATEAERRRAG